MGSKYYIVSENNNPKHILSPAISKKLRTSFIIIYNCETQLLYSVSKSKYPQGNTSKGQDWCAFLFLVWVSFMTGLFLLMFYKEVYIGFGKKMVVKLLLW